MKSFKKNRNTLPTLSKSNCHSSFASLMENISSIKELLFNTNDIKERELFFNQKKCCLLFLESVVDQTTVQDKIIKPLQEMREGLIEETVLLTQIQKTTDLGKVVEKLVKGNCVLIIENEKTLYLMQAIFFENRDLTEPNNEQVIRGSHQGFNESLMMNLHLIRARIGSPKLTVTYHEVGRTSKTRVALAFVSELVNPELVEKITYRINCIKSDTVQTPGYLEEFIEDNSFSPFPQTLNTERPDRVAANLMEGRVALIMEGSPTVLMLPTTFFAFFQSPEDYNNRSHIGSFFRLIRVFSFLIAVGLPAFYISVISYNYEVIPAEIIFSIKSSLEFVPFPPLLEAFIMQVTLELLREAAVRLPNPIAQTIGVVGGLVIGTAVVQANLVSNTMIIVVAITAISSFVIPSNEMSTSIRILGFPLMILASTFGFFGIVIGLMLLLMHLCKLRSFGMPYLYPLAPLDLEGLKDTFIRVPIWMMNTRPKETKPKYFWKESYSREWKNDGEE